MADDRAKCAEQDRVNAMPKQKQLEAAIVLFPWVDEEWLRKKLIDENMGWFDFVEMATSNPEKAKKKKSKKPPPKTLEDEVVDNPIDYINEPVPGDPSDVKKTFAIEYFANGFPRIARPNILAMLNHTKYNLAPTYKVLFDWTRGKNLAEPQFHNKKRFLVWVPVIGVQNTFAGVLVSVLKSPRTVLPLEVPEHLRAEIDWIRDNIVLKAQQEEEEEEEREEVEKAVERQRRIDEGRSRGEVLECPICLDEFLKGEETVECADGHQFCIDCLQGHAFSATQNKMKCMATKCKALFSRDVLEKVLDEEIVAKMDDRAVNEDLNAAQIPGMEKCKYCSYAVIMDDPSEQNKVFKCENPECGNEHCRLCEVDWDEHAGKKCEEVENADNTRFRRLAEERMAEAVIRRCRRCRVPLIKEEGCNKLVCKCGAFMCYLCKQTVTGYEHFCRHDREPGQPCRECNACSLYEDPRIMDQANVQRIQNEANAAAAQEGRNVKIGGDNAAGQQNANPNQRSAQ